MDISTVIGMLLGIVLIINGIQFKNLGNFIDASSIIIVIGGTLAGLIASFPLSAFKEIPKHLKIIANGKRYDPNTCIDQMVELAQTARKNGLLSLEEKSNEIEEPFFKSSIIMIVDVPDSEKIKEILTDELSYLDERHEKSVALYDTGEAIAPAFGMIGTLIGLVNMLKNMDMSGGGESTIGVDMSVALITTFYGTVLANLFFAPLAKKLKRRNEEELLYKNIVIEGVLSIQSGDNPKFLKEKLQTYLAFSQRNSDEEGEEGAKPKKKGKKKEKE